MRRAVFLPLLAVVAVLALPAAAPAATKVVYAGPPAPLAGTPRAAELDRFFRERVTVRAGDSVHWEFKGPHNVTFLPTGAKAAPAFVDPNVLNPYTTELDAAGKPFWFSGTFPTLTLGAEMLTRTAGATYDGSALRESGVPLVEPGAPKPYKLRFTKPGTYTYYCLLHPGIHNAFDGMRGTVKVLPKTGTAPSARADKAAIAKELATSRTEARRNDRFKGPADPKTVQAGSDAPDGTSLRHFYPATRTVKAGDTVTFRIDPDSWQFHTATFGPKEYLKKQAAAVFVRKTVGAGPKKWAVSPNIFLGSEPLKLLFEPLRYEFGPPPDYDGTNHGNGFLSPVALDIDTTTPNPDNTQVRFTKPGTYPFYCLVHFPAMTGKIVVKP